MHENKRIRLRIQGLVQSVGFRPFVFHLAKKYNFSGFIKNDGQGVLIELEGSESNFPMFIKDIQTKSPILSQIEHIATKNIPLLKDKGFRILKSVKSKIDTSIIPDAAVCKDCLTELFNPNNADYYSYPFLNCTHCGPRFTITYSLPYDRKNTSMKNFKMCTQCTEAYSDPLNRRFHAQPTACKKCGPNLSHSLIEITTAIKNGEVLAIKGLGGFHLVCDARNENAVNELRKRKNRDAKPFAIMALNTASIKKYLEVSRKENELLNYHARPIIVLKKKSDFLCDLIAPGLNSIGLMIPYTPLHYLLFYELLNKPKDSNWLKKETDFFLVMTSANISDEPLIYQNKQARIELKNIADKVIDYNRDIVNRIDDSVISLANKKPIFIRRARGYVPKPINLGKNYPVILGLGPELKNTFCITRGSQAFVSQYIGDLDNIKTIDFYKETLKHFLEILDVKPEYIACDLHPDFFTTKLSESFNLPVIKIQHHHAHFASVLAENHFNGSCLGLILDGYGYGFNGESWGGEMLLFKDNNFSRLGHFYPIAQPGGDKAAKESWRMAVSILNKIGKNQEIKKRFGSINNCHAVEELLEKNLNCPLTTSCGRLFDAAAAILGINISNQYEGQSPMMLESKVTKPKSFVRGWEIQGNTISFLPLFEYLLNCDEVAGANVFHGTMITGLGSWVNKISQETGIHTVALSGGCMINKVLLEGLIDYLEKKNIKVLYNSSVPSNDGGIGLGQVFFAKKHLANKDLTLYPF